MWTAMKLLIITTVFLLGSLDGAAGSNSVSVLHSSRVKIEKSDQSELRLSELINPLLQVLGYTPEPSSFNEINVEDPFNPLECAVILSFEGKNLPESRHQYTYGLLNNSPTKELFEELESTIKTRNVDPVDFISKSVSLQEISQSLDELSKIPKLGKGQRIMMVNIPVEDGSHQEVEEAEQSLLGAAKRVCNADAMLVLSLRLDGSYSHTRPRRALADDSLVKPSSDLNIAVLYTGDYPVIFNIILFLAIIMILAVASVSTAMATMDPGRDSIIYRMTNPRMKKDQ